MLKYYLSFVEICSGQGGRFFSARNLDMLLECTYWGYIYGWGVHKRNEDSQNAFL